MKSILFAISAVLMLGGSFLMADAFSEHDAVITGDNAKNLDAKITEVTGRHAEKIYLKNILSAKGNISCIEAQDGTVTCIIGIEK